MKSEGHVFSAVFCGLIGLLLASPLSADSVKSALVRMGEVVSELDYRGTFVQIQDGELETLKVTHRSGDSGSRERLVTLTGSLRELIRHHDSVKCIHSRDSAGEVDLRQAASRFHAHLGDKIQDLNSDYYSLVSLGKDRVAGREAMILGIRPLDEYRYGFRFWVDVKNGMPLRSDMINPQGAVIQQTMFTEISFDNGISDDELEPVLQGDDQAFATRHARYASDTEDTPPVPDKWRLDELPGGFRVISERREPVSGNSQMHHLIVSDGLAQVSVFVEPISDDSNGFDGESRMGAVNAHGRRMGDFQLTVVGEVPAATVNTIARGISDLPDVSKQQE